MDKKAGVGRSHSDAETVVVRRLGFLDAFFLSFGGQSVILSLLTYGAFVVALSGYFSPIVVALGTLLVLLNGLVVLRLSNMYTENGGFYNYARPLGELVGAHAGWVFAAYTLLYGGAYIVGTAFTLGLALSLDPKIIAAAITLSAVVLVALGVKPSSRYAIASGLLEISLILYFAVGSLVKAHLSAYNPISNVELGGGTPLAILLGASIPTGYGVLAQLSGEVVGAERTVGRAMLLVIVLGGGLACLYIYSLANLAHATGLSTLTPQDLIALMLGLNSTLKPVVEFAIISDGVLGGMACLIAATRTLWKMGQDGHLPKLFARLRRGEPANATATLAPIYFAATTLSLLFADPYQVFTILAVTSIFCLLYVHFLANTSLYKLTRLRRETRFWGAVALAAACYTSLSFALTLVEGEKLYAAAFLAIALGGLPVLAAKSRG